MDVLNQTSEMIGTDIFQDGQEISISKIVLIIIGVFIARFITKQVMYVVIGRLLKGQNYTYKKEENKRKNTLVVALNTITTALYIAIGFFLILHEMGVNMSALLAAFGTLGVVLGIAGQSAIKDFIKGLSILFYDQMRVGDIVQIAGVGGMVENISLQVVRLRDLDGYVHVIPNSDISVITNKTNSFANVNIDISVAYDNDVDKVEEIINEVGKELSDDPKWTKFFVEPIKFLRVDDFGEVSVKLKLLGTVLPGEQWQAAGEFRRRLKKAFEKEGIKIPYPQRVLREAKK